MQKLILIGCLSLVVVFLFAGNAVGQDPIELYITGTWARGTVAAPMAEATAESGMGGMSSMDSVSAAYMTIENPGNNAVRLIGAATPAAGVVEVHEVTMENDVMRMRPMENGLDIPAGGSVELKPGGYHIMLMQLTRDFVPGEAISLTLTFDALNADGAPGGSRFDVVVGAPIREDAPAPINFVFVNAWARPTVAVMAEATPQMGGMSGIDATAEAMSETGMGSMNSMDSVSAAYMQILNRGGEADRLVAASTYAAQVVEIHEITMENDVMRMRPLEGGLAIPAGENVVLQPGGYHIMLMQLTRDFVPGESIVLALQFESGAEIQLGVPIYDGAVVE
jgi:copper(I)-binding protein